MKALKLYHSVGSGSVRRARGPGARGAAPRRTACDRGVRTAAAVAPATTGASAAGRALLELADQAAVSQPEGGSDAAVAAAGWAAVVAVAALSLWQMISAFQQAKATIDRREEGQREKEREEREAEAERKRKIDEMFKRL